MGKLQNSTSTTRRQLAQVVHHQILVLECKASKAQRLKRTATKIENDKNPFLKL